MLHLYTERAFSPTECLLDFIQSEPRLTWTSLLLSEFPGCDVSIAGGTVRDILVGRLPHDLDLIVHGLDEKKLERWLLSHGAVSAGENTFAHFRFVPHGQTLSPPIEIALATLTMGRQADEEFAPCDFTINSMSFRLRAQTFRDPMSGLTDLHNKILRTNGEALNCYSTDPLRVLRTIRLACQLQFAIEEKTWNALCQIIPVLNRTIVGENGDYIYAVPRKLIGREFLLGLLAHPTHTLHLWKASGALALLFPELDDLAELIERDGQSAWQKTIRGLHLLHNREILETHELAMPTVNAVLASVFAFCDNGAKIARLYGVKYQLNQRLEGQKSVNGKTVISLLERLNFFTQTDPATMRPSQFEKMFCSTDGQELLLAMHVHELALGEHRVERERLAVAMRMASHLCQRAIAHGGKIPHLVSGRDIRSTGLADGPHYREILSRVRDAQLNGEISDKSGAIEVIRMCIHQL